MTQIQSKNFFKSLPRLIAVFVAIFIFMTFVEIYLSYKRISPYLSKETDIFPVLEYRQQDIESMTEKYSVMSNPEKAKNQTVNLNSTELNLILRDKFKLSNRIRTDFIDNKIHILFSIPIPLFGKFFNGSAIINIHQLDNKTNFEIIALNANGIEVDTVSLKVINNFMIKLKEKNKNINDFLTSCSSIEIKDNKLFLSFK